MTQTQQITTVLSQYVSAIDRVIRAELSDGLDEWMQHALEYHFGWRDAAFTPIEDGKTGKRLRPVMALLAYRGALESEQPGAGVEASLEPALPLAAALEMVHNYSLIHDDIEDDDRTRHGRTTLWALWGKPKAINAGDCLDMTAFRSLLRSGERGVEAGRLVKLVEALTHTSIRLTLGQQADMSFEDNLAVTPEMYLKMIGGKSAALISCATYSGALVALDPTRPGNDRRLADYALFGEEIGLGFQIRDDILGIWGLSADTGKPSGSDIRRRKKSLPVLYALTNASASTRHKLLELYRSTEPVTPAQEQYVIEVLEECGARTYAQSQADCYKEAALAALTEAAGGSAALEGNEALRQLRDLCTFLVERNY